MSNLLIVGAIVAFVLTTEWIWESKRHRDFLRKWPLLSDDEFVAKCSPGTDRERALRVRRIISEQLGVPNERIHPDQSIVDDLDGC